jgi:regulator of replication initiation timing
MTDQGKPTTEHDGLAGRLAKAEQERDALRAENERLTERVNKQLDRAYEVDDDLCDAREDAASNKCQADSFAKLYEEQKARAEKAEAALEALKNGR